MRLRATRLSAISNAMRSVFKIASVNPVLWWDAESHRAALAGGAATLFQDSAGTSPVTAVEQPVGRAIDQSGNARHALQATSTARPSLTARKNLLTYSERFDNAIWARNVFTVAANTAIAPDGTQTADTITTGASSGYILQTNTAGNGAGRSITGSLYIKNATGIGTQTVTINMSDGVVAGIRIVFNLATGTFTLPGLPTSWSNVTRTVTPVGNDWFRIVLSGTTTQWAAGWFEIIADNIGGAAFHLWGAQLEYGLSATGYQRITTASDYDITAAPLMLRFDGVDDELATATFASGTLPANADVYVVLSRAEGDGNTLPIYGQDTTRYVGAWDTPASALYHSVAGTPTYRINGGAASGSITLPSESAYIFEARNANLSAWTAIKVGKYGAQWNFSGRIGAVLITPAQSDSTRAKIRKALAKAYQITGVV